MDLSSIGTSIGQYIRQGIDFILNVNNLPITIGMGPYLLYRYVRYEGYEAYC